MGSRTRTEQAAAALVEWQEFTASKTQGMQGNRHSLRTCHRFHADLTISDYDIASDDETQVVPPSLPSGDKEQMTGVSFFEPIDELFKAAHAYFKAKPGAGRECYIIEKDKTLPENIAIHQDILLRFTPSLKNVELYPNCFRSMSNTKKGTTHVHGLHFTVYPTKRMSIEELKSKVGELKHTLCSPSAEAAKEPGLPAHSRGGAGGGGSGGGSSGGSDCDHGTARSAGQLSGTPTTPTFTTAQTRPPSSQSMRLACEALHAYWQHPDTPPNDATLSYMLFHARGARNSGFETLQHDSWATRLLYRALRRYDTEACVLPNAGGMWTAMRQQLEAVLPTRLHDVDSSDDDDDGGKEEQDEEEGVTGCEQVLNYQNCISLDHPPRCCGVDKRPQPPD
jgi:hypothetical protein